MNKKGFSLVELIIVIAIMAILVGFMAPMLIKYIEKTNVSSDIQLADTIRSALYVSVTDARIVEDPASQDYLDAMEAHEMSILNPSVDAGKNWDGSSILEESLCDALGTNNLATLSAGVKSKTNGTVDIVATTADGKVTVTITNTDCTAKGDYDQANWITVE